MEGRGGLSYLLRRPSIPQYGLRSAALFAALLAALALAAPPALSQSPPEPVPSLTLSRADGTVTADWPAVAGASRYHVTYTDDGGASWHGPVDDHWNVTATTLTFAADNAKTYTVGVRAGNDQGWSDWRNSEAAGPYSPPAPPAAPTGLAAKAGDGAATLSWDDPSDRSITGYEYRTNHDATDSGDFSGWGDWTAVAGSGASTTAFKVGALTNGAEYRFQLRAVNGQGRGDAAPGADPWYVSVEPAAPSTGPPPAPAGLYLIGGDEAITLVWDAADSDAGVTGYQYQQRDFSGGGDWSAWTDIPESGADTYAFGAIGLTNGNEYRFRLRAVNSAGPGPAAPGGDPDYLREVAGAVSAQEVGIESHRDYDSDNDRLIEISSAICSRL